MEEQWCGTCRQLGGRLPPCPPRTGRSPRPEADAPDGTILLFTPHTHTREIGNIWHKEEDTNTGRKHAEDRIRKQRAKETKIRRHKMQEYREVPGPDGTILLFTPHTHTRQARNWEHLAGWLERQRHRQRRQRKLERHQEKWKARRRNIKGSLNKMVKVRKLNNQEMV